MFLITDKQQEQDVSKLMNGSFRINFLSIKLSLEKAEVEGNGYIYQDNHKKQKLVFFRSSEVQNDKESLSDFYKQNIKGGLSEPKCKMVAFDEKEVEYTSFVNFNPSCCGNIEKIKIYEINTNKAYDLNRAIFKGIYAIPSNRNHINLSSFLPYEQSILTKNNNKLKQWEYTFENHSRKESDSWRVIISDTCEISISQYDNYLEILFSSNEMSETLYKRIVRTLAFVLGKELEPMYYSLKNIGSCFYSVNPLYYINSNMSPPLLINHGDIASFNNLFIKYYNYLEATTDQVFLRLLKNNKRLIESSRLYLFNFGQLLAIQIENIAAKFFTKHHIPLLDEESFKNDVQNLIDYVNNDFDFKNDKSKAWIVNELEKGTSPEKKTNAKIVEQLIVDKVAVGNFDSWKKLRNSIAHGSTKKADNKKLLGLIYDCIEIYYTMLFYIIKYEGEYSQPSVENGASLKEYTLPIKNNQE
ncbi:MAG: hypothetical protein JEZ09_10695 [Salinivirgaceae bacterium]|nr:hypothetical protein [Salinivirgaceae bacterium]